MKIVHKLLLVTLGGFLLMALALTLALRLTLPGEISTLILVEREEEAQRVVRQIEAELASRIELLEHLAAQLHDGEQLLDGTVLNRRLQGQVMAGQRFNGGLALFDARAVGVAEAPAGSNRIGLDISDRDHVHQVRASRAPVVTRPLISRSLGRPSFFINVPVLGEGGGLLGFLVGVTVLEHENFLLELGHERQLRDSRFYVLDPGNAILVTASDPSQAMQPLPTSGRVELFDRVREGARSGVAVDRDGQRHLFSSGTVEAMGWIVVQTIPEAVATRPAVDLSLQQLVTATLLTLLGALLLLLLLNPLLAPLRRAADAIDAMVAGRRPPEALPVTSRDEIGQLVGAFNRLFLSLEEQRRRLALATTSAGIGIWDYNVVDGTLLWDAQMYALYGLTEAQFSGAYEAWVAGLHPEDAPQAKATLQAALQGGDDFYAEFRVCHPNGEVRWIQAHGLVLRGADGEPLRMVGTNRDVSERKRVELLKSQFISTVSHELRTPLTSIRGTLGLLCGGALGPLPPPVTQMLQVAQRNSDYLGNLVNDLLDIEKLTSGAMRLERRSLAVRPLLEEVVEGHQAYADQHQVTLVLQPVEAGLQVCADEQRLRQVLSNLLSNAAKFSPPGGEVAITCAAEGDQVRFSVRDQGSGIAPEFHARIFQRFSQADASDTRQKGGTGLGLAISRELVERMDGAIGFESVPGQGATFYFTLPLAQTGEAEPESNTGDAP